MSFANPWGLLGLLAIPTIVAIHLFRRRFPHLVIAGSHLWGIQTEVRMAGRKVERLPLTASLLLELLAALLLTLLLAQPRLGEMGQAKHLVVVLDNSASMQAAPSSGVSFRNAALAKLEERFEALPRASRVTVLLTGRNPVTLAGPAARIDIARQRLADWTPTAPLHDFQAAWDRATQFAAESGELLFLTDRLPTDSDAPPGSMETVAVGEPLRNVAISTSRWKRDDDTGKQSLYLRIANYGDSNAIVDVQGMSGETQVFDRRLTISPGGEDPLEVEVDNGLGRLTINAGSPRDGLALDSTITLMEPRSRVVKIGVDFPAADPTLPLVERGLKSLAGIERVDVENADLIIGAASPLPQSKRELWWLGIGPLDRSAEAQTKALDLRGPYLLEKRHPLVEGLALGSIIWAGAQPLETPSTPLITCDRTPLLVRLAETNTTAFMMNINLPRSQLADSEDWPILLSNLVALRRNDLPGLRQWNYRLNEVVRFRLPQSAADAGELTLTRGEETRPLAQDSRGIVEINQLEQPGIYEIHQGEKTIDRFAVNFHDRRESVLTVCESGVRENEKDNLEPFRLDNPYSWLIILGLVLIVAVVLGNWRVLQTA